MATVTVSTTEFEFAHGKKPRGYGRWGFYFGFNRTLGSTVDPWFAPGSMNYGAAKKAAVAEARSRGFTLVKVGS